MTARLLQCAVLILLACVWAAPKAKQSSICDSSDCHSCLKSCDECSQCDLCSLCFGVTIGPCAQCGYCKGGKGQCLSTCRKGKKSSTCLKCLGDCA